MTSGAISPDGKYLAYTDPKGIYVKLIETGETQAIPQPDVFKDEKVDWEIFNRGFPMAQDSSPMPIRPERTRPLGLRRALASGLFRSWMERHANFAMRPRIFHFS